MKALRVYLRLLHGLTRGADPVSGRWFHVLRVVSGAEITLGLVQHNRKVILATEQFAVKPYVIVRTYTDTEIKSDLAVDFDSAFANKCFAATA